MNKELIDKCLDFAEGNKGKFTILMAKKAGFPDTLIVGTEKQRVINDYVEQGLPTRKIADKLGCTQPNIVEHMRQYKRGVAFYREWCEFWEFAAPVRQASFAVSFNKILSGEEICRYREEDGIETVGDFLNLAVTKSTTQIYKMLNGLDAEKKEAIFNQIRKMCYDLLTVRT